MANELIYTFLDLPQYVRNAWHDRDMIPTINKNRVAQNTSVCTTKEKIKNTAPYFIDKQIVFFINVHVNTDSWNERRRNVRNKQK